ncbi:MAG: iron-containing alcohol dehydrogenase, partial [Pseudomonadota bacterium]
MSLINYLTRIHFADGVLEDALRAEIERLNIRRPLFVTDKGVQDAGVLERALDATQTKPIIFAETPWNPDEGSVARAAALYADENCDGVVAIGGGSPIDLGKAAALRVSHTGPLASYTMVEGGLGRITGDLPPLIASPTTAGTGSEVGRGALITFADGRKLGIISPHLIPTVAICDPTLTLSLPRHLTVGSGMDAVAHCIETYVATAWNPPADAIAIDGLRRASAHLERASANGG